MRNRDVIIHLFKKNLLRIVFGPGGEITEKRRRHYEQIRANVRLPVVFSVWTQSRAVKHARKRMKLSLSTA
jgi:hypothetical protein